MINQLGLKTVNVLSPQAIKNNASWTTTVIDCKGFDFASVFAMLGATDIALTVLKLQESDDNSTWTDVSNAAFGTGTDSGGSASALPSATDDDKIFAWRYDVSKGKRYLKVVATIGNGAAGGFLTCWAHLGRARQVPATKTARGITGELFC